jgi:uncharacterized membrane protein YecN with MAPEG domain
MKSASPRDQHILNLVGFLVFIAIMIVTGAPAWALWLLGYIYLCVVE